jgi:hypothetical protein
MAGRPKKMTPETIQILEGAYLVGATDQEACCHADISMSTLYDYCSKNPAFSDRKELLKNQPTIKAKHIISDALNNGDLPTAHKVIDRKEGSKIDVTSAGKKIENNFIITPVSTEKNA